MDTIFDTLLSRLLATSVQAAVLVAVIWALCRWLPALPATVRCRLWWLVGAQTVLGLLWASPLNLPVLPAAPAAPPPQVLALSAAPAHDAPGTASAAPSAKTPPAIASAG